MTPEDVMHEVDMRELAGATAELAHRLAALMQSLAGADH